ncbi:MAG: type I polyketide synthase [Caldilineaceae bacterium]
MAEIQSQETGPLSTAQRVLVALKEARAQLAAAERAKHEPIAVVGLGCRFPGAANPTAFWQLLQQGGDAIGEVPRTRWNVDEFYDASLEYDDTMNTRWGGFLDQIDQFDPAFFGLSNAEAAAMDPQQRLLLEVSWEALEDAAIAPSALAGSQTGVFVGVTARDYYDLMRHAPPRAGTGILESIIANRLSYQLDLQGPSLVVNTACSSSLVAVHLACQSLRMGESALALAGGVHIILSPQWTVAFSQAGMTSADGHCKTFDAAADGYVRAEGCGMVVLKRLADAERDGDRVYALIRGSAVNQDGRSTGLTAPNGVAQQRVIRQALANAGVAPGEVDYVEAHGTGTPLGDAIELHALKAVLGAPLPEEKQPATGAQQKHRKPCALGSVKANIGHLEAAAGIAGLIKAVLAVVHGEAPPHPRFASLNPHLGDLDFFEIPTIHQRSAITPHIAGISSFGIGGTNAHVIVAAAPTASDSASHPSDQASAQLLTLSAKSQPALVALAARYQEYLATQPGVNLADVCFTANTGRAHFQQRLAIVAGDVATLQAALAGFASDQATPKVKSDGEKRAPQGRPYDYRSHETAPKVAFLFAGQGTQVVGMGRRLYPTQPTFRRVLDQCDEILQPVLGKSLLHELLYPPQPQAAPLLDQTTYAQPALFALEYALATLWQSWGVKPDAVMGHSVGEYVAACVAGVMALEEGLHLIAERGRLMGGLPQHGAMTIVFAEAAVVADALAPHAHAVSIAAHNGPKQVVLSGEAAALATVVKRLEEDFYITRPLNVSHAFHSPLMEPILAEFTRYAAQIHFAAPTITLVSNLTGQILDAAPDAQYWRDHIRQPVRFADGIATVAQQGITTFVEIGPSDTLINLGRRCLPKGSGEWLASLAEENPEQWLHTLAALYTAGVQVDWTAFAQGEVGATTHPYRKLSLPTYPFQRRRCWLEAYETRTFTKER